MSTTPTQTMDNGIAVIHSNQLEALRDVVEYWMRQHPLSPLENEILLVQSNGMGQWLKQGLAHNNALGIAAAMQVQLPALFIWSVYRAVLGPQIPLEQPLAKAPLTWRLFRLLPNLIKHTDFASLAHFLEHDPNQRKQHQLAEQLADLFDQYQVYRSDWISDWAAGKDDLHNAHGEAQPLPDQQRWQALLWRAVLADLGEAHAAFSSRAAVHSQFMSQIDQLSQRPPGLPRRILLFGLSSLPQQSLEVLAKLGKFCQIVLFVHNPCRHYWADIIEDKELLKAQRRRQSYKAGMASDLNPETLHLHANPLLAAWGKQGRDYIRLLDQFDETQAYANWHWPDHKIDLFKDYGETAERSLLQQLQQAILDLEPLPEQPVQLTDVDESLVFHIAHSPQREVEILHDQLLARFNATQPGSADAVSPRDIIVMVPDINLYAPHIRAVFGQIQTDDPRYIPFSLADQQQRGENPLLLAIEALLNLPDSRFNVSEFMGLLESPALRNRFSISEVATPKIHQWLEQSGIRWGLNAEQRQQQVEIPDDLQANSWEFGLNRLLLGYAVGAGEAFNSIQPYEDIGGLDAQWLGHLCHLLDTLKHYASCLQQAQTAQQWLETLSQLLTDFFIADTDQERKTLDMLTRGLSQWSQACELGGFAEADLLPLSVVRDAWLSTVDEPNLHQRFLSGRVNFCTLMPMRAIPFRLICLLGMNDGDYPRGQYAQGFDLMNQRGQYRPGDRSRRQDDQYLFLEAILSARQYLYISWVGRSIRDNSERPPSVLIGQLRDYLNQGWCLPDQQKLLDALTVSHPLQPFSAAYVQKNRDPRLFTYAKEWFESPPAEGVDLIDIPSREEKTAQLSLETLSRFLKAPVKYFCQQRLKFSFIADELTSEDNEPFGFDRLQAHAHSQNLLNELQTRHPSDISTFLQQQKAIMAGKGLLPLAGFADNAFAQIAHPAIQAWRHYQALLAQWPTALEPRSIELSFTTDNDIRVELCGALNQLRLNNHQQHGLLHLSAQTLVKNKTSQPHKLIGQWLQHLAACAAGLNTQSILIGADQRLTIHPLPQNQAYSLLTDLIEAWQLGLQNPLPIACRTGFDWLNAVAETAKQTAQSRYEGDDWNPGEVAYDAYLARFYPDFASLYPAGQPDFEYWADKLYRPLNQHLQLL